MNEIYTWFHTPTEFLNAHFVMLWILWLWLVFSRKEKHNEKK
jgi:hypothetical protein